MTNLRCAKTFRRLAGHFNANADSKSARQLGVVRACRKDAKGFTRIAELLEAMDVAEAARLATRLDTFPRECIPLSDREYLERHRPRKRAV